jgi:hypothetical protein
MFWACKISREINRRPPPNWWPGTAKQGTTVTMSKNEKAGRRQQVAAPGAAQESPCGLAALVHLQQTGCR